MSVSPTCIPTHTPPKEHSAVQALQTLVLSCMTCFLPAYARADKAEQDRKGGGARVIAATGSNGAVPHSLPAHESWCLAVN